MFAEIDENTLLLDPERAAAKVSPRTAALMPVHLYGQTCDLHRWSRLALEAGALLIQDACQAHGARHGGLALTEHSPFVAYSFYPTKNLGALGDGGALCTARAEDALTAKLLRDGGRDEGHVSVLPGINSRLDEMQASYLRVALRHLEGWNRQRRKLAAIYDQELMDLPAENFHPVARHGESDHMYHLYVARAARRDALKEYLAARNVVTGIHYTTPLHLQPAFAAAWARVVCLMRKRRLARSSPCRWDRISRSRKFEE